MQRKKPQSEMSLDAFFDDVISRAIVEIREARIPLYTFGFYHDHESAAVSVCADTAESSAMSVRSSNRFNSKYFAKAVAGGDLKDIAMWKANHGRSLSLGDFAKVNAARTDLAAGVRTGKDFYLAMIRAVIAKESEIARLATHPEQLIFCCSGPKDEVAFIWSATTAAA
jgi:hypothetical protein